MGAGHNNDDEGDEDGDMKMRAISSTVMTVLCRYAVHRYVQAAWLHVAKETAAEEASLTSNDTCSRVHTVDKVRGAQPHPCSHLSSPAIVWSPPDWTYKVLFYA